MIVLAWMSCRPLDAHVRGAAMLRSKSRPRSASARGQRLLSVVVAAAVGALLAAIEWKVDLDLLLFERFLPGFGWIEIVALSAYGGFLADRLRRPDTQTRWRVRAWRIFSFVFFAQLALGLVGFERFLMTGELHLPVPALIAAGPLYRGEGLFMLGLFLSTVVLVGPAWCSHLCYVGAWDDAFARRRRSSVGQHHEALRVALALVVVGTAIVLRVIGASTMAAAIFAASFGLIGVAVMAVASRRRGRMVHCTVYCPIGLIATRLGRLSPWRLRIDPSACTECMVCARACRFGALDLPEIRAGRPAPTCTLCTDCITECPKNTIGLRLPGLRPATAQSAFVGVVTTLHVVFLGVARI